MRLRLVLAFVLTIVGAATAVAETQQADQSKGARRKAVPARSTEAPRPAEQKWVEDSINKFFDIPGEILNPQPNPPPPTRR